MKCDNCKWKPKCYRAMLGSAEKKKCIYWEKNDEVRCCGESKRMDDRLRSS